MPHVHGLSQFPWSKIGLHRKENLSMSSYMYSKTHSVMTRCGPSRTTTCTFRFEADALWGRILTLMNLGNQPPNWTLNPPSHRRTWSRYHQTRQLFSQRTWDWSQHHRTRSWLRIHTDQICISMRLAMSETRLPIPTTFPM